MDVGSTIFTSAVMHLANASSPDAQIAQNARARLEQVRLSPGRETETQRSGS
jgi:hypothetical protein